MPADPIVVMEALSAEYGWTPDQIRTINVEEVNAYLRIIAIKRALQKFQDQ